MVDKGIDKPFEWVDPIYNNLFLSVHTQREDKANGIVGGRFWQPDFGTRLKQIKKTSGDSVLLARDEVVRATKWMIEAGKVKEIDILVVANGNRFDITATVTKNDGTTKTYALWYDLV